MVTRIAWYPYQTAVTAYGNGGFRFADMSHRGSILCLPSGIYSWHVAHANEVTPDDFADLFAEVTSPMVFLLGTGDRQVFPSAEIAKAFAAAGMGIEPMSTGAAARTYNVLLAEKRAVCAALIAVE